MCNVSSGLKTALKGQNKLCMLKSNPELTLIYFTIYIGQPLAQNQTNNIGSSWPKVVLYKPLYGRVTPSIFLHFYN